MSGTGADGLPVRATHPPKEIPMRTTDVHTRKDTVACASVLLAILLSTVSGAYLVYSESTPMTVASTAVTD